MIKGARGSSWHVKFVMHVSKKERLKPPRRQMREITPANKEIKHENMIKNEILNVHLDNY